MSIFVDTSAMYALLVSTEEEHAEVTSLFRELAECDRRMVTTNYVDLEATALLQHRFGIEAVRDFETRVLPLMDVVWIDQVLRQRALKRLFRSDRRQLSLVDCASFVVMDMEGIGEALSLDSDFEREGYRLLPSPLPSPSGRSIRSRANEEHTKPVQE